MRGWLVQCGKKG
jgi:hypothetical protein